MIHHSLIFPYIPVCSYLGGVSTRARLLKSGDVVEESLGILPEGLFGTLEILLPAPVAERLRGEGQISLIDESTRLAELVYGQLHLGRVRIELEVIRGDVALLESTLRLNALSTGSLRLGEQPVIFGDARGW